MDLLEGTVIYYDLYCWFGKMKEMIYKCLILFFTITNCFADVVYRHFEYKCSFKAPYLAQYDGSIPFWSYAGSKLNIFYIIVYSVQAHWNTSQYITHSNWNNSKTAFSYGCRSRATNDYVFLDWWIILFTDVFRTGFMYIHFAVSKMNVNRNTNYQTHIFIFL